MKIYANIKREVEVNPHDFISKLLKIAIGDDFFYLKEENGKYFLITEERNWETQDEISKEKFDYIQSLQNVQNYIRNKNIR